MSGSSDASLAATPSRAVVRAVLLIFMLSGAAGLIYEVVWSRQLVLVFGNTTQAVSAILTGFFGGMAIGSALGGRLADRVRSPLRLYGAIELVLAGLVVITPLTFQLIDEIYRGLYGELQAYPQLLALIRFGLALLALGPATILMGATLPTLTRHLTHASVLSAAFGRLYAANTVGAILGTLAAGLLLIELLGLTGALVFGASCSLTAGAAALLLARGWSIRGGAWLAQASQPGRPRLRLDRRTRLALGVAFMSGLTSLGYQVLWTRLLSSGTGSLTYTFTIILGLFLYGIAIGAVLFNAWRPRLRDPLSFLGGSQILVAVLALAGAALVLGRPLTGESQAYLLSFRELIIAASIVVLPATVVMGLAFPATSALLPEGEEHAGAASGTLVAINTIGAIIGSFVVPFLLVPAIGSPQSIGVLAAANALLGVWLLLRAEVRARSLGAVRLGVGGVVVLAALMAAGGSSVLSDPSVSRIRHAGGEVFETREDEIASVQAGQVSETPELWIAGTSMTLLTVDARLMPLLPLMARPDSTDSLIVAFGMGSSFRSALVAGLSAEAIELVPSVPPMFRWYYADAEEVLADPRGSIVIADGRNHLELTERRYDIIITDPPPPLESSGASVISSLEYYRAGHDRLKPGGVMVQWLPWGSTLDELKAHIRSFAAIFPEVVTLFGPGGFGMFMLGSDEQIRLDDEAMREVLERPGVLEDLAAAFDAPATSMDGWIDVIRAQTWLSGSAVREFAGDGPLITDDHPLPEYFLLRRSFGPATPAATEDQLRSLTSGS